MKRSTTQNMLAATTLAISGAIAAPADAINISLVFDNAGSQSPVFDPGAAALQAMAPPSKRSGKTSSKTLTPRSGSSASR